MAVAKKLGSDLVAGTKVAVRLSGRDVTGIVIERTDPSGSLENSELALIRVKLGELEDSEAPTIDVPREWLKSVA